MRGEGRRGWRRTSPFRYRFGVFHGELGVANALVIAMLGRVLLWRGWVCFALFVFPQRVPREVRQS
jgi:hypothetical protein